MSNKIRVLTVIVVVFLIFQLYTIKALLPDVGVKAAYTFENIDSSTHTWDMYRKGWVIRPVLKS